MSDRIGKCQAANLESEVLLWGPCQDSKRWQIVAFPGTKIYSERVSNFASGNLFGHWEVLTIWGSWRELEQTRRSPGSLLSLLSCPRLSPAKFLPCANLPGSIVGTDECGSGHALSPYELLWTWCLKMSLKSESFSSKFSSHMAGCMVQATVSSCSLDVCTSGELWPTPPLASR